MTSRMSCSMISTPQPSLSLIREMSATSSSPSASFRPAAGSSRRRKLRAGRDGAGDAHALLLAEGEPLGRQVRAGREAHPLQHLGRPPLRLAPPEADSDGRDLDVLGDGETAEQADVLEGAREPAFRASRLGGQIGDRVLTERDRAGLLSGTKPLNAFISVVLPAPLGPIRPRISP